MAVSAVSPAGSQWLQLGVWAPEVLRWGATTAAFARNSSGAHHRRLLGLVALFIVHVVIYALGAAWVGNLKLSCATCCVEKWKCACVSVWVGQWAPSGGTSPAPCRWDGVGGRSVTGGPCFRARGRHHRRWDRCRKERSRAPCRPASSR